MSSRCAAFRRLHGQTLQIHSCMAVLPQVCFYAGLKLLPSMLLLGNGHVVGAVNVPLDQLTAAVKGGQLPAAQEPIALICQSGRCARAVGKLACCWQQALDAE